MKLNIGRATAKTATALTVSIALAVSTAGIASAAESDVTEAGSDSAPTFISVSNASLIANGLYSGDNTENLVPAPPISEDDLLATFQAIEEIPESVLQSGDAATQAWLKARLGAPAFEAEQPITTFGVVGCVSAIGLALVTNLPVFKVTKIRTALKAAGGAATFVRNFKRVYDDQRRAKASFSTAVSVGVKRAAKAAGPEAQQLLIELFNLGNVYSACFE